MTLNQVPALALLLWNLRNALARWASDVAPEADTTALRVDSLPTAYDAMPDGGFSLHGAYHDPANTYTDCPCKLGRCRCEVDPLTGAKGFGRHGEATGFRAEGSRTGFDAEAELEQARMDLENLDGDDDLEYQDGDGQVVEHYSTELERTIADLAYADGGPSEGIADTTELSDTYWVAIGDAHVAEMRAMDRAIRTPVGNPGPLPGELRDAGERRERYVATLGLELGALRRRWLRADRAASMAKSRAAELVGALATHDRESAMLKAESDAAWKRMDVPRCARLAKRIGERKAQRAEMAAELERSKATAERESTKAWHTMVRGNSRKAELAAEFERLSSLLDTDRSPYNRRFLPFTKEQGKELKILA